MFSHLSIKAKLYLATLMISVFLIVLGGVSIYSLAKINDASTDISKVWMARIDIAGTMDVLMSDYRKEQLGHILAESPERIRFREDNMQKIDKALQGQFDAYGEKVRDASRRENLEKLRARWESFIKKSEPFIALSRQGKRVEATAISNQLVDEFEAIANEIGELKTYCSEHGLAADQEAEALYNSTYKMLAAMIVVAIFATGFVLLSMTRMISGRLDVLVRFIGEYAQGDLKKNIAVRTQDELGKVGESVNKMADNLRHLLQQIQKTSGQVAAASEELTASADQSSQVTQQIARSISEVSELSTQQLAAVDSTTNVIEQISAGVEETAATASVAAEHSKRAVDTAREGNVSINNAVQQMNSIETTVNKSAEVVAKLGERSKEIGQIVDTISGIAGQTNLLALNAAIEAARAGEQGKGFAVVAEEVRKLAEQSQEAAEKIAGLIGDIQTDTEQAVVAMNEGTQEVKEGAKVVSTAGDQFVHILEMVESINQQAGDIAKTMDELARGTEKIVSSVQAVDHSSKSVAAESQSVSAATEEQSASMEEIAASSRSLANLAQELQEASNRFRL